MTESIKPVRLYVGGHLPNHINSTHIRDHFKAYEADITDVMVMRNMQTKHTLGFAVVTFSSRAAAEDAIGKMDGSVLHGTIRLKVEEKHDRRHHTGHHPYTKPSHDHSGTFTVAIDSVNCALMEYDLKELMENMGIRFSRCRLEADDDTETKSARIEFSSQLDAETAVRELDGRILLGQQVSASIVHEEASSHSLVERQPLIVKVSHIPSSVTKATLETHFQQVGYVTGSKIHLTNNPYAHVHFNSHEDAKRAVETLNGTTIDGQVIGVRLYVRNEQRPLPHGRAHEQKSPFNEQGQLCRNPTPQGQPCRVQSGPPIRNQRPLSRDQSDDQRSQLGSYRERHTSEQAVDRISGQLHEESDPPQRTVSTVERSPISTQGQGLSQLPNSELPYKIGQEPSSSKVVITCSPEQWNRLLTVDAVGNSLFQELTYPFKSNPNVQIQPLYEKQVIVVTGAIEAVTIAKEHIEKGLIKDTSVDKIKMAAMLHFFPDLNAEIEKQCGVKVSGYLEGSTMVHFEGRPSAIKDAKKMLDNKLQLIMDDSIQLPYIELIPSANKILEREGLRVFVIPSVSVPTVHLCAYEHKQLENAKRVLKSRPFENYIDLPTDDLHVLLNSKISDLQATHGVCITMQPKKAIITGYIKDDVHAARHDLEQLVNDVAKLSVPLKCSHLFHLYLNTILIKEPTEEDRVFTSSLPAKISFRRNSGEIFLTGTQQAIEQAQGAIQRSILSHVQHKEFPFCCNIRFLSQIKQHIFAPYLQGQEKLDFVYFDDAPKKPSNAETNKFSIVIFSRIHDHFIRICTALEGLKPSTKRCSLKQGSINIVSDLTEVIEQKYRARVVIAKERGEAVLIHALTDKEAKDCWAEIEESINSELVTEKSIPLSRMQMKYLEVKCKDKLQNVKRNGLEIFIPHNDKEEDSFIKVKGTVNQVSVLEETLKELFEDDCYCETEFDVESDKSLLDMWIKRWQQIKDQQERLLDILIEFTPKHCRANQSSVAFNICGREKKGIEQVKTMICTKECKDYVKKKTIQLPSNTAVALSKELCSQESEIGLLNVKILVDKNLNNVTIVVPEQASDDLIAAEEVIQKHLGGCTVKTENITFSEPVLGLIFTSEAGKRSLAEKFDFDGASVRFLKPPQIGVSINGIKSAIDAAKPKVQQILKDVLQDISQISFFLPGQYSVLLGSGELSHFLAKLQTDQAVLCTFPTSQPHMNKTIHSLLIKPTASAHCVKFEIVDGNIVNESVSALVNAANETLEHIGGLAKTIAEAGGPTLQADCNTYIKAKGKLKPGDAVCLDSGDLPCRKVIHAVGPQWTGGGKNEEATLYFTIQNILKLADKESLESIALPAISCGIFGVPADICARATLKSIRDFCQGNAKSNIHTIRCILCDQTALLAFCEAQKSYFPVSESEAGQNVLPDTSAKPIMWQWENDEGSFSPFSREIDNILSDEYVKNPNASFSLTRSKHKYIIDFSSMVQRNTTTKKQRMIKYTSSSSIPSSQTLQSQAQWCYMDDTRQFIPYTPQDSIAIQSMFLSKVPGVLIINSNSYTFDFNTMHQINTATNYKRPIKFQINPSTERNPCENSSIDCKNIMITLRGPKDNLENAKSALLSKIKNSFSSKTVPLPAGDCILLEKKFVEIAGRHQVTYSFEACQSKTGNTMKEMKVEGLTSAVLKTVTALQEEIISYQSSAGEVHFPSEWQPQTKTTELFPLSSRTSEWNNVAQKFMQTMSHAQIASIQRIQNTWLWDRYVKHRDRLKLKNGGVVNEMELFHGTRNNDPKLIYEGEEGFDMRYSAQGMWGIANYFAANASYSDSYAHQTNGQKEMFLVKVLTGDSYNCPPDSSLRMPPTKPHSAGSSGQLQLNQMKYDTVTGTTHGSQVFMAYDNEKAYPAYLITYTQSPLPFFY